MATNTHRKAGGCGSDGPYPGKVASGAAIPDHCFQSRTRTFCYCNISCHVNAPSHATTCGAGERVEREFIFLVLEETGGHRSRAAERLGIDRRTLYRKLSGYREEGGMPDHVEPILA